MDCLDCLDLLDSIDDFLAQMKITNRIKHFAAYSFWWGKYENAPFPHNLLSKLKLRKNEYFDFHVKT